MFNVRGIEKLEEKSQKEGVRKCAECWEASPIYRGWNALKKKGKKRIGENPKKRRFG